VTAFGAEQARTLTPLEMAQNAAAAVARYAELQATDPVQSHVLHAGESGRNAAQVAGSMALVSIAEDLHWLVAIMTGRVEAEGGP